MRRAPFDTTGYSLDRAREIAARAGWRIAGATRIGPVPRESQGGREMVVRQVAREDESVELAVAGVWATAQTAETREGQ
jgi:hypothetical protein